jgi:pimeloyl-ACP methyl ester carboxylesterase
MHSLYLPDLAAYLRYQDLPGVEPAWVYLHGLGLASSTAFPAIVRDPRLAAQRAILIDLLGFGFSDHPPTFPHTLPAHAAVIAQLLDALGLRACTLVGHSLGGSIAIALAAARPDLIDRLVVAEPNLDPVDASFSGTLVTRWPTEAAYLADGHTTLLAEEGAAARADPTSLVAGNDVGTLRVADPRALYRCAEALVGCDLRETFFGLNLPRVYVYGERTLPHRHEAWLAEHGVPIAIVPAAGHDMPADNPAGFAAALAAAFALA